MDPQEDDLDDINLSLMSENNNEIKLDNLKLLVENFTGNLKNDMSKKKLVATLRNENIELFQNNLRNKLADIYNDPVLFLEELKKENELSVSLINFTKLNRDNKEKKSVEEKISNFNLHLKNDLNIKFEKVEIIRRDIKTNKLEIINYENILEDIDIYLENCKKKQM